MDVHKNFAATPIFEARQEILVRSVLLLLGCFVTLFFLLSFLKNENEWTEPARPALQEINRSDSNTIPSTQNTTLQPIKKSLPLAALPLATETHVKSHVLTPIQKQAVSEIMDNTPATTFSAKQISLIAPQPITINIGSRVNLKNILLRNGVSFSDYKNIMSLPQAYLILSHLSSGKSMTITFNQQKQLQNLQYQINRDENFIVTQIKGHFQSYLLKGLHKEFYRSIDIIVRHPGLTGFTLLGISHSEALQLETIFHEQIDVMHLPINTVIKLVLMEDSLKGHRIAHSEIISAEIAAPDKTYTAVKDEFGKGQTNFYTPQGKSLEKGFLRTPVHYVRISSPFNPHRYHPILHIYRPHYGVDLAAPYGTPIYAASNGIVTFASYENGFGNVVKLRYNAEYSTVYGHMEHFAKGIHTGTHLKEGQVLGYVGSTGLATGSHLHYEFHIYNRPVDPLTVKLPFGNPIPSAYASEFRGFAHRLLNFA